MWSIFILSKNSIGHLKQQHQKQEQRQKIACNKIERKIYVDVR